MPLALNINNDYKKIIKFLLSMFITETWYRITFGTKFVLISTILCCIFDMMTNDLLFNIFVDIPKNTLYEIQIWRLIIPQFFHGKV